MTVIISLLLLLSSLQISRVNSDDSTRTPEERAKAQQRRWGTPGYGAPRPPGTLLLNMLIKNEEQHLDRTLPKWAKVIDYWIIGVDDHNTDHSPQIIIKHLGHIPGHIVIVPFDGMGPTWSILVQHSVDYFPNATHGIIADADFAPMKDHLDKMELDIRCSKHMYTIWAEDHRNERKMDWIYRNIWGAKVNRRTHQTLEVPELKDQEVFQTLIDLPVDEREGGYQDRTPGKNERYIGFLLKDLIDYPNDTRTLYYLGYAHYDNFRKGFEHRGGKPNQDDWDELEKGMTYMRQRINMSEGNKEERWFTMLKMGEIYERYLNNWSEAERYYQMCVDDDPQRADSYFYIGQHYRLVGDHIKATQYLKQSAQLSIPERSLFQWHFLYNCLSKLEYGRALINIDHLSLEQLKEAKSILKSAQCSTGESNLIAEMNSILAIVDKQMSKLRNGDESNTKIRLKPIEKIIQIFNSYLDTLEEELDDLPSDDRDKNNQKINLFKAILKRLVPMTDLVDAFTSKPKKNKKNKNKNNNNEIIYSNTAPTCRQYRLATTPFLRFIKQFAPAIFQRMDKPFEKKLNSAIVKLRTMCR